MERENSDTTILPKGAQLPITILAPVPHFHATKELELGWNNSNLFRFETQKYNCPVRQ